MHKGITATAGGFGPQGRILRLNIQDESLNSKMDSFKFEENRILISGNSSNIWSLFGTQCTISMPLLPSWNFQR
jgi:hypothetical protein